MSEVLLSLDLEKHFMYECNHGQSAIYLKFAKAIVPIALHLRWISILILSSNFHQLYVVIGLFVLFIILSVYIVYCLKTQ